MRIVLTFFFTIGCHGHQHSPYNYNILAALKEDYPIINYFNDDHDDWRTSIQLLYEKMMF